MKLSNDLERYFSDNIKSFLFITDIDGVIASLPYVPEDTSGLILIKANDKIHQLYYDKEIKIPVLIENYLNLVVPTAESAQAIAALKEYVFFMKKVILYLLNNTNSPYFADLLKIYSLVEKSSTKNYFNVIYILAYFKTFSNSVFEFFFK